jgi:hypothetical protein
MLAESREGGGGSLGCRCRRFAAHTYGKNNRKIVTKQTVVELVEESEEKQQQARQDCEAAQGGGMVGKTLAEGKAVKPLGSELALCNVGSAA